MLRLLITTIALEQKSDDNFLGKNTEFEDTQAYQAISPLSQGGKLNVFDRRSSRYLKQSAA